jgi:hypothetical protein
MTTCSKEGQGLCPWTPLKAEPLTGCGKSLTMSGEGHIVAVMEADFAL